MKIWKYAALVASGGVLWALSGCASTVLPIIVDIVTYQVTQALLQGVAGATT